MAPVDVVDDDEISMLSCGSVEPTRKSTVQPKNVTKPTVVSKPLLRSKSATKVVGRRGLSMGGMTPGTGTGIGEKKTIATTGARKSMGATPLRSKTPPPIPTLMVPRSTTPTAITRSATKAAKPAPLVTAPAGSKLRTAVTATKAVTRVSMGNPTSKPTIPIAGNPRQSTSSAVPSPSRSKTPPQIVSKAVIPSRQKTPPSTRVVRTSSTNGMDTSAAKVPSVRGAGVHSSTDRLAKRVASK